MAVGNVTVTTAEKHIKDAWSNEVLRFREKTMTFASRVWRFDTDAQNTDKIHIPNVSQLSARAKAASTVITYEALTETESTIDINKHMYAAVLIEDVAESQAYLSQEKEYAGQFGYVLGLQVDTDLAALIQTITNTVGTLGVPLTDTQIRQARRLLDAADVPQMDRFFVFSVEEGEQLIAIEKYISRDFSLATASDGYIGTIYGIPVVQSNNLTTGGGGHHSALLQKQCLALAMQKDVTPVNEYSVDHFGKKLAAYNIYGTKLLRPDAGAWIKGA